MHDKIYNKVHNIFHNDALFTTWLIASYTMATHRIRADRKKPGGQDAPGDHGYVKIMAKCCQYQIYLRFR